MKGHDGGGADAAAARAVAEGIEVRRVNATGVWVATSGSTANVAYVLDVADGTVRSCSCPAGAFGNPCCKHIAAFYLAAGTLDPEPPTPAARYPSCRATGAVERVSTCFPGRRYQATCRACVPAFDPFADRPAAKPGVRRGAAGPTRTGETTHDDH